jgi:hypothetical protein
MEMRELGLVGGREQERDQVKTRQELLHGPGLRAETTRHSQGSCYPGGGGVEGQARRLCAR